MRHAGQPELLQGILGACTPMRGRMIHGKKSSGALYELPQDFDAHGRVSFVCPIWPIADNESCLND